MPSVLKKECYDFVRYENFRLWRPLDMIKIVAYYKINPPGHHKHGPGGFWYVVGTIKKGEVAPLFMIMLLTK